MAEIDFRDADLENQKCLKGEINYEEAEQGTFITSHEVIMRSPQKTYTKYLKKKHVP